MAEVVQFSREAGLMSLRVDGQVYLLDQDDLAMVGAVILRLMAEGHQVTPTHDPDHPAPRSVDLHHASARPQTAHVTLTPSTVNTASTDLMYLPVVQAAPGGS